MKFLSGKKVMALKNLEAEGFFVPASSIGELVEKSTSPEGDGDPNCWVVKFENGCCDVAEEEMMLLAIPPLATVNVVEMPDTDDMTIAQLTAFADTEQGNQEAEQLFAELVKENYAETTEEEIQESLEDGYFQRHNYRVYIIHSTVRE